MRSGPGFRKVIEEIHRQIEAAASETHPETYSRRLTAKFQLRAHAEDSRLTVSKLRCRVRQTLPEISRLREVGLWAPKVDWLARRPW